MSDSRLERLSRLKGPSSANGAKNFSSAELKVRERIPAKVLSVASHNKVGRLQTLAKQNLLPKHPPNVTEIDEGTSGSVGVEPDVTINPEDQISANHNTDLIASHRLDEETSFSCESESSSEDENPLLFEKPTFVPVKAESLEELTPPDAEEMRRQRARTKLFGLVRKEYSETLNLGKKLNIKEGDDIEETEESWENAKDADDADDYIDEEEEVMAWQLRELLRLKRDLDSRELMDREKLEIERIRSMTAEERRLIDIQKEEEWLKMKPQTQMKFMQKYYHKGAFFLDSNDPLLTRDYTQATGVDALANKEFLPGALQVRDFGRKGRSKWTHLVNEDTTNYHYGWGHKKNELNYRLIGQMGGMRSSTDPSRDSSRDPTGNRGSNTKRPKVDD